jgi:predicted metal-dependent phosphoesterase TrpH/GNAT superfamily N-acetyltransferase
MIATRTYLQITSRDQFKPALEKKASARVERIEQCSVDLFRHFYREVGRQYHWTDRLEWTGEQIRQYLDRPEISFWVLFVRDEPAGYFELRRDTAASVEIAYFGLLPAFIGQGLGKYLLSVAVDRAWTFGPQKVWLHTSTLDHPAALRNYLARGFDVERTEDYEVGAGDRMIKLELHAHTNDDPHDWIPHSATQLIDHAAALGYNALAITLHDRQVDVAPLDGYARERGITLIPGIERSIAGKHVLLINFPPAAAHVRTFDHVAELKRHSNGLVVAPHPFFPAASCLGALIDRHAPLIDAVEWNACYTRAINFNRAAERWAARHGKPVVGNTDVHRLWQMGTSYSLVDAEPDADAICDAVRAGRVRVEARPISSLRAAHLISSLAVGDTRAWFAGRRG